MLTLFLSLLLQAVAPPAPPPAQAAAAEAIPVLPVTVVARHPHDPAAFTEGLIWHDGALWESVGREGASDVRRVDLATGRVTLRARIPAAQFGEGLAAWKGELVSLTWHDGIAHRWRARDLKPVGRFRYPGEGWGLASGPTSLWMTDGGTQLREIDPATFAEKRRVTVTLRGRPLKEVNELEVVDGQILANVWHTPYLVRIDPASGKVTAIVDLRPLVAEIKATDPEAVANGIAWDAGGRRLFVTGKLWPTLYEVKVGG